MYIIEYRYRSYRQPWTDWKEHHSAATKEEALEAIEYLELTELEDRADGLAAWGEKTEYRVVSKH